jgi:hypothetical protein
MGLVWLFWTLCAVAAGEADPKITNLLSEDASRRLSSWSPHLSVPGQMTVNLCPGDSLEVSMCPTTDSPNEYVECVGDPSLQLLYSDSVVASNDDYCGTCPSLLYTASGLNCSDYLVNASCSSGNCSGTAGVMITTTRCSVEDITTSPQLRLTGGTYPGLDCSLIELYRNSICGLEGTWSIVSGGNQRNPCSLKGPGYGCDKYTYWIANSFFVCLKPSSEEPLFPTETPSALPSALPISSPIGQYSFGVLFGDDAAQGLADGKALLVDYFVSQERGLIRPLGPLFSQRQATSLPWVSL